MKITAELIERFFNKECTAEEAEGVASYLHENPAELDKYLDKNDWDTVQSNDIIPKAIYNEAWKNIKAKQKKSALIVLLKKSAVAAAIAAVILTAYYRFSMTDTKNSYNKTVFNKTITPTGPRHKIISNESKQVMKIILQDSSVISLSPGAVISYDVPFQNNKRDVLLTGEALFTVAKDKAKPFTVLTGSLTTTALGTKFKITMENGSPANINVKLFEGKVVIRSTQAGVKGWKNDIYLLPGQQMKYDADKMVVDVDKIKTDAPRRKVEFEVNETATQLGNELNFDGTALPNVIDELSKYYSVKIEFNKAEIATMHFTGSINKKDSLTNVLQLIGQMNNLNIIKGDEKFIIQKNNSSQ